METIFGWTCGLDYLRRIWLRAIFAFRTRYQQDLDLECRRKECKERFGCTQSGNCTHCGKYIQMDLGKHSEMQVTCAVVALPGYAVYGMEGDCSGLY